MDAGLHSQVHFPLIRRQPPTASVCRGPGHQSDRYRGWPRDYFRGFGRSSSASALLRFRKKLLPYSRKLSGGTSYTIDALDSRKNSYVRRNNTIWRAVRANSGIEPGTRESVWTRGDTCGKLLKSCKIRYQGMPLKNKDGSVTGNYSVDGLASPVVDTNIPLPFGAFPGTRKFR